MGQSGLVALRRSSLKKPRLRPQQITYLFEPGAKGIVEQVGVSLRRLNLRVAQELSDHRQ